MVQVHRLLPGVPWGQMCFGIQNLWASKKTIGCIDYILQNVLSRVQVSIHIAANDRFSFYSLAEEHSIMYI